MINPLLHLRSFSEAMMETQVSRRDGSFLSLEQGIEGAVEMILRDFTDAGKIMLIGNGGSTAIVSHMQNDLCASVGVRAMVFNEPSLLTALTNDFGYETAFEKLVDLWADPGDLLIAISSSGRSQNILRAVSAAIEHQCRVMTYSGFKADNPLRGLGDLNFYVPASFYGHVEVAHMGLMHAVTDLATANRKTAVVPKVQEKVQGFK